MVIFNKDLNADKVVHSCNLQFNLFHSIGPETARNERLTHVRDGLTTKLIIEDLV